MSQQECAGLGAPRPAVVAGEPFVVVPEAPCMRPFNNGSLLRAPERVLRPPITSATVGVGHAAATMISFSGRALRCIVASLACPELQSRAVGVGQDERAIVLPKVSPNPFPFFRVSLHFCRRASKRSASLCVKSSRVGAGHGAPVKPASDVRRVDGASRDIDRPAGVAFALQVRLNSVEPTVASRSRNLLSHDDSGPAGTDEAKHVGPQVPSVVGATSPAGDAERLTGAGTGPDGPIFRPSGKMQGA